MKVKEMIKENNRLREQMTPFNRSYMEDMIIFLRESRLDKLRTEELLLEAAHKMLEAQSRGKNAKQVFGERPEDYFKDIAAGEPSGRPVGRTQMRLMIPWIALTWLFGVFGTAGLVMQWRTGSAGAFGQISLFAILAVGIGSVILIEVLMNWLNSLSEDDAPKAGTFNLKSLGIYIAGAVAVVALSLYAGRLLPAIPLSPWAALLLFAAGLAGQWLLFRRK